MPKQNFTDNRQQNNHNSYTVLPIRIKMIIYFKNKRLSRSWNNVKNKVFNGQI